MSKKIKGLDIATEITASTVFVGAIDETSTGTKQYPFGLMQDFIYDTSVIDRVFQKSIPIALVSNSQIIKQIILENDATTQTLASTSIVGVTDKIRLDTNASLTSLSLPNITYLGNNPGSDFVLYLYYNNNLVSVDLTSITTIGAPDSLDPFEWMGMYIGYNAKLTNITFPNLTLVKARITIEGNPMLNLDLSKLTQIEQLSLQAGNTLMTTINLTALTRLQYFSCQNNQDLLSLIFGVNFNCEYDFVLDNCGNLVGVLDLTKLRNAATIKLMNLPKVTSINLSNWNRVFYPNYVGQLQIMNNTLLTNLILPPSITRGTVPNYIQPFMFSNSPLNQASVDGILAAIDAGGETVTPGINSSQIFITNGPSAPSAAGLVSKTNLETKGWTVFVTA